MREVAVECTCHIDVICVPEEVARSIKKHYSAFNKWIFDKRNDHGYWIYHCGKKFAVSFGTHEFVEYLNSYPLRDSHEKAYVAREDVQTVPSDIPSIFF